MAAERLTFEQRKLILKWHRKFDDVCEVRGQRMCVVSAEIRTRITFGRIRENLRPRCAARCTQGTVWEAPQLSAASAAVVLQEFTYHQTHRKKMCSQPNTHLG
jgi:hypothetical protein